MLAVTCLLQRQQRLNVASFQLPNRHESLEFISHTYLAGRKRIGKHPVWSGKNQEKLPLESCCATALEPPFWRTFLMLNWRATDSRRRIGPWFRSSVTGPSAGGPLWIGSSSVNSARASAPNRSRKSSCD
jgi:hypothetical protein